MMTEQDVNKNTLNFQPVPNQRVSEAIFEQIRDKILSGELKPKDRLPSERTLIEIFHRSRPTIREALRMLERSGLIVTIPGSGGAVIMELSSTMVQQPLESMLLQKRISHKDLYEFRIVNEIAYVQWATERRSQDDIEKMRQIVKESEECKDDWNTFFKCDVNFHLAIVESTKNQMSIIVHHVISSLISETISRGILKLPNKERNKQRKEIITTHKAIIDAIEKQDKEKVKQIAIEHLERFKCFINDGDNAK